MTFISAVGRRSSIAPATSTNQSCAPPALARCGRADERKFATVLRRATVPVAVAAAAMAIATGTGQAAVANACDPAEVVAKALPSTVNITVLKVMKAPGAVANEATEESFEVFVGSGAIIDPSGIIVTNRHVIQDAVRIWATFSDRSRIPAQLVAAASLTD